MISPRIGLLANCRERRAGYDSYALRNWVGLGPRIWGAFEAPERVFGGGASEWRAAKAAAIGEAAERMSLSGGEPGYIHFARVDDVPCAACDAASLSFFLEEQHASPGFPIPKPDFTCKLAWSEGWALVAGRAAFMPSSLIYLPYRLHGGEPALTDPTSVGCACRRSPALAAAFAILELVERDAWTMAWETRAPAPRVADDAVLACPAARQGAAHGLTFLAFDLTNDVGIPVMLVLAQSDGALPAIAIGTAAHLDPSEALDRAIAEALTSWRSTAYLCREPGRPVRETEPVMRGGDIFRRQSLFYARPENGCHFDFLRRAPLPGVASFPKRRRFQSGATFLAELAAMLRASGHEVVLYDLTMPDFASFGLHVVRAVSTTLLRPTLGILRHLAHPRLLRVPKDMGRLDPATSAEDLLRFEAPPP